MTSMINSSRRRFLQASSIVAAGITVPSLLPGQGVHAETPVRSSDQLRIGLIGVGVQILRDNWVDR